MEIWVDSERAKNRNVVYAAFRLSNLFDWDSKEYIWLYSIAQALQKANLTANQSTNKELRFFVTDNTSEVPKEALDKLSSEDHKRLDFFLVHTDNYNQSNYLNLRQPA